MPISSHGKKHTGERSTNVEHKLVMDALSALHAAVVNNRSGQVPFLAKRAIAALPLLARA